MFEQAWTLIQSPQVLARWLIDWSLRLLAAAVAFGIASLVVRSAHAVLDLVKGLPWDFGIKALGRDERTALLSVAKGFVRYAVYTVTALLVLSKVFDVSTASLITASGVIGLAVGFGLQGFVRDLVTGLFVLIEDAYSPGDLVEIAGQSGVVEEISVRTTRLRDVQGELRIIPNGNVGNIVNYTRRRLAANVNVFVPEGRARGQAGAQLRVSIDAAIRRVREMAAFFDEGWMMEVRPIPEAGIEVLHIRLDVVPFQRALVDQMLVPVIRDVLEKSDLKPFKDRIVVHYAAGRGPLGETAGGVGGGAPAGGAAGSAAARAAGEAAAAADIMGGRIPGGVEATMRLIRGRSREG